MDPTTRPSDPTPTPPEPPAPRKTDWRIFWGVLLAPAILSFLSIAVTRGQTFNTQLFSPMFFTFFGSLAAGIFCGIANARNQAKPAGINPLLVLFSIAMYFGMSLALCFIGCAAAGGL